MKTIHPILFLASLLLVSACNKSEDFTTPEDPKDQEPTFSITLDSNNEFPVGHNLGLNYFNDTTVGILENEGNISLLTTVNTSSFLLEGPDLENLNAITPIATPEENTFYPNYVGLGQVIQDRQGIIYSAFHAEEHDGSILPGNVPGFYASIGLATSTDQGRSFELSPQPIVDNIYDINYDNGFADGGLGEPSITFSKDSTQVFLYYVDHNRSGRGVNICMAKFDVAEDGNPDFDHCYYLNNQNQFTNTLIRSKEVVAGIGSADATFPHVTYNKFTDSYIMVYSLNHYGEYFNNVSPPEKSGIYIRHSQDGISWTEAPEKLIPGWSIAFRYQDQPFIWHPTLVYTNAEQSEGYLIYSRANSLKEGHKMYAMRFDIQKNQ